ncbi:MAG: right-handed parallel beta-helix repeat-containing protein [Candidatus Latescibacteria bacterium]|nr:right-handed parallel beta-helix repeat-containing protein [Candidatus Latescibacterota bacterium]
MADYYTNGDDGSAIALPDTSHDTIDVTIVGTDYIVFRAGDYYNDGGEHELQIRIEGQARQDSGEQPSWRVRPMGWVIGYCCEQQYPQLHSEDLVFIEPLRFDPPSITIASASASATVTEFGRSIQTVVIAMTLAPDSLSHAHNAWTSGLANYFTYEYEYGVATPGAANRIWDGDVFVLGDVTVPDNGTLAIDAGTYVKVSNDDLSGEGADVARVEFNIDGELVVNGTAQAPVTIHPWTQATAEDWAGIYFSAGSEGGTFSYCTIGYADFVIDSYAPVTIENSTIRGASDALISVWSSTLEIDNSTIRLSNGDCIRLDESDATISGTTIEDYQDYGIYSVGNGIYDGALTITDCEFLGDPNGVYDGTAVYVEGTDADGVISNTRFEDSEVGVKYYDSSEPNIDECVFTGNDAAIECGYGSSPMIEHCIDSASYDGNITENGNGLVCTDDAAPGVGACNFEANAVGVVAFDDASPVLQGYGANSFILNTSLHVGNFAYAVTIGAQGAYWQLNTGSPNYYPKASKISGSVDYTYALASGPNPVSPRPTEPPVEAVVTGMGKAHPNPFNPTVQIPYSVSEALDVQLEIFDVTGRLVRTLVRDHRQRGQYVATWDGRNNAGEPSATSIYFARMRAGNVVQTQKLVLLK